MPESQRMCSVGSGDRKFKPSAADVYFLAKFCSAIVAACASSVGSTCAVTRSAMSARIRIVTLW